MSDVERVHTELMSLRETIRATESLSDINAFEAFASKALLLAAASYFEKQVCAGILDCARAIFITPPILTFIEKQALERKFHTMFDWKHSNINKFLSLFGSDCKKQVEKLIASDDALTAAMADFIYVNSQRNLLVHNNFASYNLDASLDDIWAKFVSAQRLTDWLPPKLLELSREATETLG